MDLVIRDRDQLKNRNEILFEENTQINNEIYLLNENFLKLEHWKKNILETIGDQNYISNNPADDYNSNAFNRNYNENNKNSKSNYYSSNANTISNNIVSSVNNKKGNFTKFQQQKINCNSNNKSREVYLAKKYETEGDYVYENLREKAIKEDLFDRRQEAEQEVENEDENHQKIKSLENPIPNELNKGWNSGRFNLNNSKNKFYLKQKIKNISDQDSNSDNNCNNDSKKY